MELSKEYMTEWRIYIAEPMQREVNELRQEVAELWYVPQRISDYPYRADSPALEQLQRQSPSE